MEKIKHANGTVLTDNALHGWLAYGSALYHRDHFSVETRDAITVGMAKNEIEGFEYLMASNCDYKGLTCRVSDFTDGKGNTLTPAVYVAWYTDVYSGDVMHETGFYPDALLPIDDPYQGGTFDVHAGRSQMIYVKVKTDKDTPHGTYTATLEILDGDEVLLTASVTLKVWNIAYSEKTECLNTFGYFYDLQLPHPASTPNLDNNEDLREEYADFLLANRMTPSSLPYTDSVNDPRVGKYLDDPNFTITYVPRRHELKKQYEKAKANGWLDKLMFLIFDEPHREEHMDWIHDGVAKINEEFPTTQHMNAFLLDMKKDGKNIAERMIEFSTVHSPKIQLYAGEVKDSLQKARDERGDKILWYVCGNGDGNRHVNLLACTTGTEKRGLFWQQYQQKVDGFFYWSSCWWNNSLDVWDRSYYETGAVFDEVPEYPVTDGLLIYWHPETGKPVGTLGLESVRDGIEDYQLLSMADKLFGRETIQPYVEKLTTDTLHYTADAEALMAVRCELAEMVEKALNK